MGVEERGIFSCEILTRYYFHNKRSLIFIDSYIYISLINLFFYQLSTFLTAPSEEPDPGVLALQLGYTLASGLGREHVIAFLKYWRNLSCRQCLNVYHIPKVLDKVLNNFHTLTFHWQMKVNSGMNFLTFCGLKWHSSRHLGPFKNFSYNILLLQTTGGKSGKESMSGQGYVYL